MRSIKPTTIRLSEDDIKMVEAIKQRYGVSSLIAVIRIALRIAAGDDRTEHNAEQQHTKAD